MIDTFVPFSDLSSSDLIVDQYYQGGFRGNAGDDPISKLLPCGNMGGFRIVKNTDGRNAFAVLYSSENQPEWPDYIEPETGLFTYYGDNRKPGSLLHETPHKGNELLREIFDLIHSIPQKRENVPPFFIFTSGNRGRDVRFRGLAAPGSKIIKVNEDLIAIWANREGQRFQNYKAIFTILNSDKISRKWGEDLVSGNPLSENCPDPWKKWVVKGFYNALRAKTTEPFRRKEKQIPSTDNKLEMINCIYEYFKDEPTDFEYCAARLVQMMDNHIKEDLDVTRPSRDGGRDAIGLYTIGTKDDFIKVGFAVEAKCYKPGKGVGVKSTSRLISRLRHRQFGVLVTTSHLDAQAYKELREDEHPIIVMAGEDIANLLMQSAIKSSSEVLKWLQTEFPK
jgi:hypothetical protein